MHQEGTPREKASRTNMSLFSAMRRGGHEIPGLHATDGRGQYNASGSVGRNDPCPCEYAKEGTVPPHKAKRHQQAIQPIIDQRLEAAAAEAQRRLAEKDIAINQATGEVVERVEPTVISDPPAASTTASMEAAQ